MADDVTLREYIESRIDGIETAIQKAEEALNIRLEHMNEFREQISRERGQYLTKEVYEEHQKAVDERLKNLEMAGSFSSGKMWMVMAGFALIPTVIAIIAWYT